MAVDQDLDCQDDDVAVRFVIPEGLDETRVSDALEEAFNRCREAEMGPVWVEEAAVLNVSPTKTDVFVMDPFAGPAFDHLTSDSKFRCTVVGPRCLLSCLTTSTPVPEMPYPLYTAAMRGLNVSFSGLDPNVKKELKKLVEQMSGIYSKNFHDGVTHLVAGAVGSEKYNVAIEKETPIMTVGWVREVWKASCATTSVTAQDPKFSVHRCPALLGVTVSVSKMGKDDKEVVKRSVEEHGGTYSPSLEKDQTTALITPSASGDKYAAAKRWNIPIITSNWVFDSVATGHMLPFKDFRLESKKTARSSTPTKDETVQGLAEVSMCSTILNPDETMSVRSVEETINSTALESGLAAAVKSRTTVDWLNDLDLAKVKKAGAFLDGCKVFLSGFTDPQCVQLTRVLKFAGAARLTQLVESVTHVVHAVTEGMVAETARLLTSLNLSPHHVTVEWLVESMRRCKPVQEASFAFRTGNEGEEVKLKAKSPPKQDDTMSFEAGLLAQYGMKEQNSTTMTETATMSQVLPFFSGLTFQLLGFPEQRQQELSDWITEAEGDLVYSDHQGKVDYLLVPIAGWNGELRPHRRLVTELWLEDCLDANNGAGQLLPIEFQYRPVKPIAGQPLEGVVACLSGYGGNVRVFLAHLVGALGGLNQEVFAKRDKDEVRGSTHLICPDAGGSKYTAAMKWKLPVVSKDWLQACLRDETWVSEKKFLVGDAKTVTSGKPEPSEPEEETNVEEEVEEDTVTNMSVDEVQRSYGPGPSLKASPPPVRAPISVPGQVITPVTPLSALRMDSPTTAVRKPVRPQVDSPSMEVCPPAARVTSVHTPGQTVDSPMATQTLRPKPINLTDITVTPQRWADSQPSPSGESSSVKRRRSEEEASSNRRSGQGMATPTTPYGSHFTPNPTPRTRKFFKTMAGAMPKPELTELERRQMEEFANFRPDGISEQHKTNGEEETNSKKLEEDERRHQEALDLMQSRGLPVLERDSRPFEDIMEEHYQKQGKSWKTFSQDAAARARAKLEAMDDEDVEKEENKVLEGVTVCVARKLISQAEEVHKVVKELGGKVSHHMDENATHLVFRGQQNDKTKEFRMAREAGIFVISPDWVFMCRDEGRKVEEELFPHTFNPRKKLDITGSSPPLALSQSQPRSSSSRKRKVDTKVLPPVSLAMSQISQTGEEDEMDAAGENEQEKPLVSKEVSGDLEAMASLLDSRSGTPISSNRKVLRTKLSNQEEKTRTPKAAKDEEEEEVSGEEEKKSQVMWVDPIEEEERRKLKEQVNALETQDLNNMVTMDTMETMDTMGMTALEDEEKAESNKENRVRGNSFVFMVSGLSDDQIKQVEDAMVKLGGRMTDIPNNFDPKATHMITGRVARSEKILCSVASGCWVLHPSYIPESLAQGRWLEEERFEWGNELNGFLKEQLKVAAKEGKENTEVKLAAAARRWRLQGAGGEAFSGWKVILVVPDQKKGQFERLIAAGGGKVVEGRAPFTNAPELTHMLTESRYLGKEKVDYSGLAMRAVPVLKPIYLNDFLTSEKKNSSIDNYMMHMLDDAKPHWEKMKRKRVVTDTPTNEKKKGRPSRD